MSRFEAALIRLALWRTGGHQLRAARLLGLKANTLSTMMKRYGISGAALRDAAPDGRELTATRSEQDDLGLQSGGHGP